jgi:carbonic anhydrase
MAEEGINSQPFTFLESYLPLNIDETKTVGAPFNMTSILPNNRAYYNYSGSLTTPPCSEHVTWVVLKTPITISEMQLIELQKLMPKNNYRNQQPLNGRVVKMTN